MPARKQNDGGKSSPKPPTPDKDEMAERQARSAEDPSVERGERIESSKAIARGGKDSGRVKGTEEDASQDDDR